MASERVLGPQEILCISPDCMGKDIVLSVSDIEMVYLKKDSRVIVQCPTCKYLNEVIQFPSGELEVNNVSNPDYATDRYSEVYYSSRRV